MTDMTLENALSAIESEADNIGGEYHYVASRLYEAVESIRDHLAKAAQPVEAVDEVLPVPFAIDRTHENQAFVTMGFDSVDDCTQFIKKLSSSRYRVVALAHPRHTGEHNDAHVATVYTMEALVPGGRPVPHAEFHRVLPAGTKLYTAPTGEQAGEVAWTKKAAEFIEKKAQSYADEFGRDDMGSISFGAGRGADKMEEYWMSLIDLAEDFRKLGGKCQVPPDGWECSRAVGHDGPCAASPAAEPDGEVG